VRQLTAKAASLENALAVAEKAKKDLSAELAGQKDLNSRLKETAVKQISPEELITLQNEVN
jgi:3-keto-L-gulonate-6-phosphate decarboxylase